MPETSVIIPLYNKARVIGRALDSILQQTYKDFEIIVVDDGSTDDGAALVAKNPDARIRLITQTNAGPGAARNRGLAESRSRYVAFLDADDEWLPDFLAANRANLETHPECAAVFCRNLQGSDRKMWAPARGVTIPQGVWKLSNACRPAQLNWIVVSAVPSVFCQREAIAKLGGFYENRCKFGEDIFLWLLVCLNHAVYLEPRPLVVYHTEDSELNWYHTSKKSEALAKVTTRPLNAWLVEPDGVRKKCPPEFEMLLEDFLAYDALSEANTRAGNGDLEAARVMRDRFPAMKSWKWNYLKLRIKLLKGG